MGIQQNALALTTSQQGRILNVQEAGNYTITYTGDMSLRIDSTNSFLAFFEFYLNINGTLVAIFPTFVKDYTDTLGYVGPKTQIDMIYGNNNSALLSGDPLISDAFLPDNPFSYTGTFYLPVGGYVDLFGVINYGGTANGTFYMDMIHSLLSISLESSKTVNSSIFTNPLNITEYNNKQIRLYGGSRDTLIIKGNKLTS